jgi:hypothetical protein
MGTSGAIRRIAGGVLGVLYVAGLQSIGFPGVPLDELILSFLNSILQFGLLVGLLGGAFLAVRLCALVLGLARASRGVSDQLDWTYMALMAMCFLIYFVNTPCAVWAALAMGPVHWRVILVFFVALLLCCSGSQSCCRCIRRSLLRIRRNCRGGWAPARCW